MKKCLVIGAAMLDITMHLDRLPLSGEDMYADKQEMAVGGCAYNVADILKHFRVPYTLFAPVGTGIYADFVGKNLKKAGHESPIRSAKMDNGYCLSLVEPNGERTFLTLPGIECNFEPEWFHRLNPGDYDSVYVCGYELEGAGGSTILDFLEQHPEYTVYYAPGPRITYITPEKHERMFALHPVVHLNETEALHYTGETDVEKAAKALSARTHNTVIVTMGAEGVYLLEDGKVSCVRSQPVKAVDSTGAGDSHIGAVIAQRQRGHSFMQAIQTANRVSALVVGVNGPVLTDNEFAKGEFENE